MRTLYVADLDGTLLNSASQVSEYSMRILNRLMEEGVYFTYATARSLTSATAAVRGLSVRIPVIVYNGTFLCDPVTGERIVSSQFTKEEILRAEEAMRRFGLSPFVYSFVNGKERVSWDASRVNAGMREYLQSREGDPRFRPIREAAGEKSVGQENVAFKTAGNLEASGVYAGDVFYFTCIGKKDELMPLYEEFRMDGRYTCTFLKEPKKDEYWCEIRPANATKAAGLLRLKELLGCDRVVCFGDAGNDIPMFELADERYAVANASEELKQIADGVIPGNDEDGVARWMYYKANQSKLK